MKSRLPLTINIILFICTVLLVSYFDAHYVILPRATPDPAFMDQTPEWEAPASLRL